MDKKVYSGDYSEDAYNQGVDDAKKDKPKNKYKFFKAVHPINYVWNFNRAYDSFAKNYDSGYLDGQRVKNNIYNSNQQKGKSMNADNYESHLWRLKDAQTNIASLKGYLNSMEENYKKQIQSAKGAGFVQNYTDTLEMKHPVFSAKIYEMIGMIERNIRELESHEELINMLMNQAQD